jgi:hypothetical protein
VLEALGLLVHVVPRHADDIREVALDEAVAADDPRRVLQALVGERDHLVLGAGDVAVALEAADHLVDGRRRELHRPREVRPAHREPRLVEPEQGLEVLLLGDGRVRRGHAPIVPARRDADPPGARRGVQAGRLGQLGQLLAGRAVLEVAGQAGQAGLGEGQELAGGGRQARAAARDEGERVVHRLGERHPAQRRGSRRPRLRITPAREQRVPQAARGELDRHLDVLHVDVGLEDDALALGHLRELPARGVLRAVGGVEQDEPRPGEVVHGPRAVEQRGIRGGEDDLVAHDRPHVQPAVVHGQGDHPHLELALADLLGHVGGVQPDEAHANPGELAAEVRHDLRAGVEAGGAPRAERRRAAAQPAHLGDRVAGGLHLLQDALGVVAERPAGFRGHEAAPAALEERDAELCLQAADLLGERGLREVQLLRGGRERPVLDGGQEVLELLDRHIVRTLRRRSQHRLLLGRTKYDNACMVTLALAIAGFAAFEVAAASSAPTRGSTAAAGSSPQATPEHVAGPCAPSPPPVRRTRAASRSASSPPPASAPWRSSPRRPTPLTRAP